MTDRVVAEGTGHRHGTVMRTTARVAAGLAIIIIAVGGCIDSNLVEPDTGQSATSDTSTSPSDSGGGAPTDSSSEESDSSGTADSSIATDTTSNSGGDATSFRKLAPAKLDLPGTGPIESHSAFVLPNGKLIQSFWRDGRGWFRTVPFTGRGAPNWNNADKWRGPYAQSSLPGSGDQQSQVEYILPDGRRQVGFWRGDQGWARKTPFDGSGNPDPANGQSWQGPVALSNIPGNGEILSQTAFLTPDGRLFQEYWRGGRSWARYVPFKSDKTRDWGNATSWMEPMPKSALPGSGTINAQSSWVMPNGRLRQVFWRGGEGWARTVPFDNAEPDFSGAGSWEGPIPVESKPLPKPNCKGPAYLHGNVWPFWYNYRVQCDYEHKKYWRCKQNGGNCTQEKSDWKSCDVCKQKDGICIPRSRPGAGDGCCDESACCNYSGPGPPNESTHFWGYFRSCRTNCDTRDYDYQKLDGHFYGKSWKFLGEWSIHFYDSQGNDITGQIKGGKKGTDTKKAKESDDALGYFGCYELPTGQPITIKISLHDWDGKPATKQKDLIEQTITPKPGKHYVWRSDGLKPWSNFSRGTCVGPPSSIASRLGGLSCSSAP